MNPCSAGSIFFAVVFASSLLLYPTNNLANAAAIRLQLEDQEDLVPLTTSGDDPKNAAFRSCCGALKESGDLTLKDKTLDMLCNYTIWDQMASFTSPDSPPTAASKLRLLRTVRAAGTFADDSDESLLEEEEEEPINDDDGDNEVNLIVKCMGDYQDVSECCNQAGLQTDECSALCDFSSDTFNYQDSLSSCAISIDTTALQLATTVLSCAYNNAYNDDEEEDQPIADDSSQQEKKEDDAEEEDNLANSAALVRPQPEDEEEDVDQDSPIPPVDEAKNAAFRKCCGALKKSGEGVLSDELLVKCNYTYWKQSLALIHPEVSSSSSSDLRLLRRGVRAAGDSSSEDGESMNEDVDGGDDDGVDSGEQMKDLIMRCMADYQDNTECCSQAGLKTDECSSLCDFSTPAVLSFYDDFSSCAKSLGDDISDRDAIITVVKCAYTNAYNDYVEDQPIANDSSQPKKEEEKQNGKEEEEE